jgi:hypothetical protein
VHDGHIHRKIRQARETAAGLIGERRPLDPITTFTAFAGARQLATGDLLAVARAAAASDALVVILEDASGRTVDLDLRGGPEQAAAAHPSVSGAPPLAPPKGRGRPRLGVVAREVTLLPRHWDWLATQPGGASAALRRLVEEARRATDGADRQRQARDALYRAMSTLAGDLPGFEEATRALFAAADSRFDEIVARWPGDIAGYLARLSAVERGARSGP